MAAAVAPHRSVDQLGEPDAVDDLGNADLGRRWVDPPQPGVNVEVAPTREPAVDDRVLEHDAAHCSGCDRLGGDVEAGQSRRPAGRSDGRREHADGGRLARPVGSEQAEHLAGVDLEVDPLHRLDTAGIGLAQPAHLDHRLDQVRERV